MTKDVGDLVGWSVCQYKDLLEYLQPTKYIVESTKYNDNYKTPVLTAGKSFIKGYTNELEGVFENLPTIIFDDFTTASRYVNFPFKVKSSAMKILIPSCKLVNLKFVFYCMQNDIVRSDTHKRYWISVYSIKELNLPPLAEQNRIVAKIEQLFSELDKGIESLKKAREQLKVYRQAVLKHAFEGKLTEKWRDQNKGKLKTADQLLTRIQKEREARYQLQLDDWKKEVKQWEANGKINKKPVRISKLKLLPSPNAVEQRNLPFMWCWSNFCNVTYKIGDIDHKMPKDSKEGYPYLSTGNLKPDGTIDFSSAKIISEEDYIRLALKIKPERGDIIFPRYGTIGRNFLVDFDMDFLVSYSCAIIKNITSVMDEKYIYYFSLSPVTKMEIKRYVKETTQANIGIASIEKFIFPLCSSEEQKEIVSILESRLTVLEDIDNQIENSLLESEILRQSILKKAFSGRLVEQDPNDEPASVLLELIKAEKEKQKKSSPKTKTNKKKTKKRKIAA